MDLSMEVLKEIDKLRRAYLSARTDKVTGGKCKVNREQVCKLKEYGGLGILNLGKFVADLRILCLCLDWDHQDRSN